MTAETPIPGRDFDAKLANIDRTLRTARADYERAALQHEEGKIGVGELEQAEAAIQTLESRRRALIAAQAELKRKIDSESREAERQGRLDSAGKLRELVDVMEISFAAAVAGILAAAPHLAALKKAREDAMSIAARHAHAYRNRQELGDARRAVLVDLNRERWAIDAALYQAGFGDFGLGSWQAMTEAEGADPIDALIFAVREIRSLAARLEAKDDS